MHRRDYLRRRLACFLSVLMTTGAIAAGAVHHVDPNGREGAFRTIQAAIDAAEPSDAVLVHPGRYRECINFNGKSIHLASRDGPEHTTIDGAGSRHVVQCVAGEDPNAVLEGFTITGGRALGAPGLQHRGAGMLNVGSRPTVRNCIFTDNQARNGAGMYNQDAEPTVVDCVFVQNGSAGDSRCSRGGGMLNLNSHPVVAGCTFIRNVAGSGAALYNYRSSPKVTDCAFSRNAATRLGSAMCNVVDSGPTVIRCTFVGNGPTDDEGIFNDIRSGVNATNGGTGSQIPGRSAPSGTFVVRTNASGQGAGRDNSGSDTGAPPEFGDVS